MANFYYLTGYFTYEPECMWDLLVKDTDDYVEDSKEDQEVWYYGITKEEIEKHIDSGEPIDDDSTFIVTSYSIKED